MFKVKSAFAQHHLGVTQLNYGCSLVLLLVYFSNQLLRKFHPDVLYKSLISSVGLGIFVVCFAVGSEMSEGMACKKG